MHIEIQVALNFVISYLYNKLPRRRVNIFGEELEKALKDKFQGHWYPEKPFKGSAFRCLKIGDPHDSVLSRAARESGVPISDILENLPHELSVWVDPGEVSYRIGEKGAVKILYSENSDNHEENTSADREVNKTFNPEAQVFRPIDIINNGINGLSLSPKTSPHAGSSPHSVSSASPTYKGSPNPAAVVVMNGGNNGGNGGGSGNNGVPYMTRLQAPLTFTTATFAQTKFGSTKLKTNSKRSNSSAYRMSPTEFSNYIKQRAMQQQLHHGNGGPQQNHYGPIGAISPARSISPNPLNGMGMGNQGNDPYFMHNMSNNMYPQYNNGHRNIYDAQYQLESAANGGLYGGVNNTIGHNKFGAYLEPHGFYGMGNHVQQQQQNQQQSPQHQQQQSQKQPNGIAKTAINGIMENANNKDINAINGGGIGLKNTTTTITVTVTSSGSGSGNDSEPQSPAPPTPTSISSSSISPSGSINGRLNGKGSGNGTGNGGNNTNNAPNAPNNTNTNANTNTNNTNNQESNSNSKLIDGLSSFYSNAATGYQQLLVAN